MEVSKRKPCRRRATAVQIRQPSRLQPPAPKPNPSSENKSGSHLAHRPLSAQSAKTSPHYNITDKCFLESALSVLSAFSCPDQFSAPLSDTDSTFVHRNYSVVLTFLETPTNHKTVRQSSIPAPVLIPSTVRNHSHPGSLSSKHIPICDSKRPDKNSCPSLGWSRCLFSSVTSMPGSSVALFTI